MARQDPLVRNTTGPQGVNRPVDPTAPLETISTLEAGSSAAAAPGKPPAQPKPPATPVRHFRVLPNPNPKTDGVWKPQIRGMITPLVPGKVLASTSYNIEDLQRQGVMLEEVPPPKLAG